MRAAIGVFDSGVGGLTVLAHVRRMLPGEDLVYLADSAHAPYGVRPAAWIRSRCLRLAEWFEERPVKGIVVACNTATAEGVAALRERLSIPVVGIEPAVKPAVAQSRAGCIGVLVTPVTAASEKFRRLCDRFREQARILVQPCPGLVEQIEAGELDAPATRRMLEEFTCPLIGQGADVLVLGCTHYPLLMPQLRRITGASVEIVEPGEAVARELVRRLREAGGIAPEREGGTGSLEFWSSDAGRCRAISHRLWPEPVIWHELPEAYRLADEAGGSE